MNLSRKQGDYAMMLVLVPMDEPNPQFSGDTMSIDICTRTHGTPLECAAMLQSIAAYITTSIENEIAKRGK